MNQSGNRAVQGPVKNEPEILITLEDVHLGYDREAVLHGVDLVIRRGDFLGLIGPNGAGKTTLLRGILGSIPLLKGRMRIESGQGSGKVILGYVPQVQNLDPIYPLTVKEVVYMGAYKRLGLFRFFGREERAFMERCLEEVDMVKRMNHLFSRLSAGQKQRVLIARALFTRPDVLLLDEPTSGADTMAEQKVMALLERLNQEGHTLLLVCHELDAVQQAVREILWVSRGRVHRDAPARLLSSKAIEEMYRS
jgi:ABC-type Mn2+/Zn2+ transport system ATPase subunit